MNLPLCTFSSIYITLNPRSLMHLLSLRTLNEDARYISHPQWETDQVAQGMEETLRVRFPSTYAAFNEFEEWRPKPEFFVRVSPVVGVETRSACSAVQDRLV